MTWALEEVPTCYLLSQVRSLLLLPDEVRGGYLLLSDDVLFTFQSCR